MSENKVIEVDNVVIRFAGDSGDGMQLTGTQFTNTTAVLGNSLATLPDYPAEIRAPQGTIAGVSGFQIQFGDSMIFTPGDEPDVLVAMNPAALKANLSQLKKGGTLIINQDAFSDMGLQKAGYAENPLENDSLDGYNVIKLPISTLTKTSLNDLDLDGKSKERCKNFFALGLMYWMYTRPLEQTVEWIQEKFAKKDVLVEANIRALKAGYGCGSTTESLPSHVIKSAPIQPGVYRNISGNEATAYGLILGSQKANKKLFLGSYPITPASDVLHLLAKHKEYGVVTFQAEDEIAAVCSAIGASFGGSLGITSTSGPGLNLKSEAIGLAVKTELPLVIVDVQRAGPSTGLPTKTEQSDLLCAMFGRNGESPLCILAAATPIDCFQMAFEAVRLSLDFMTPVILLTDGYLANGSEPWLIPNIDAIPEIKTKTLSPDAADNFFPYVRDENLVRQWASPGLKGCEHRLTGLETNELGNVSYDGENHEQMIKLRQEKIQKISEFIPDLEVEGDKTSSTLLIGWGSTYGFIKAAVQNLAEDNQNFAHAHFKYLNPFPKNTKEILEQYEKIIVLENNLGQLALLLQQLCPGKEIKRANKISGQPFKVKEIIERVLQN